MGEVCAVGLGTSWDFFEADDNVDDPGLESVKEEVEALA